MYWPLSCAIDPQPIKSGGSLPASMNWTSAASGFSGRSSALTTQSPVME